MSEQSDKPFSCGIPGCGQVSQFQLENGGLQGVLGTPVGKLLSVRGAGAELILVQFERAAWISLEFQLHHRLNRLP